MIGRRTILGLCMLCALAVSAFAVQGATAAGLTAYTCKKGTGTTGGQFKTEHCKDSETSPTGEYGHFEFSETTHATLTNDKTNETTTGPTTGILKETIAATNLELRATGVHGTGKLRNEVVAGEMTASAESTTLNEKEEEVAGGGLTFTGVTVAAPAGKGCKVFEDVEASKTEGTEGTVKTKPIKGHTKINGAKHHVIFEPQTGTVFATFFITCTKGLGVPEALEGTWEITGTVTCPIDGATINCDHEEITTANTLKGKGAKAGLSGKTTITAGKFPKTEATFPISATTTAT